MTTMVLGNIKEYIKTLKERIGDTPKLVIIQVGNIEESNYYIKNKVNNCEEISIIVDVYQYSEDITEYELCENIKLDQEHYDGVIVQLPLPPHIREKVVVAAIDPLKDVDGFHLDKDREVPEEVNLLTRCALLENESKGECKTWINGL